MRAGAAARRHHRREVAARPAGAAGVRRPGHPGSAAAVTPAPAALRYKRFFRTDPGSRTPRPEGRQAPRDRRAGHSEPGHSEPGHQRARQPATRPGQREPAAASPRRPASAPARGRRRRGRASLGRASPGRFAAAELGRGPGRGQARAAGGLDPAQQRERAVSRGRDADPGFPPGRGPEGLHHQRVRRRPQAGAEHRIRPERDGQGRDRRRSGRRPGRWPGPAEWAGGSRPGRGGRRERPRRGRPGPVPAAQR